MQDLLDTLRTMESDATAMDNDAIVDAAGKENLGGGVAVGLTVTLQNAKLAFEARSGPSFELCRVSGGNLVAIDANGDTFDTPISPTAYTQVVLTQSSSATLSTADVKDQMVEALTVDTYAESSAPPAATASIVAKLCWLATLAINRILVSRSAETQTLRNSGNTGNVGVAQTTDDGDLFTRGKWS